MIQDFITTIFNNTISSFDFSFCITANIATYLIIQAIIVSDKHFVTTWFKRIVFLLVAIALAFIYYFTGSELKTIVNSFILAPVSWSWIFKPICKKLNIDYKKDDY